MGQPLKEFVCWLQVVLPPRHILVYVFAVVAFWEFLTCWLPWLFFMSYGLDEFIPVQNREYLVFFVAIAYGGFRASLHPYFRDDYLEWLLRTPWTSGHPLPMGPVTFVLQDLVIFIGLFLLSSYYSVTETHWLIPAVVIPYSIALAILIAAREGHRSFLYVVVFLYGSLVLGHEIPMAILFVTALIYLACLFAAHRTFSVIESGDRSRFKEMAFWRLALTKDPKKVMGWPFQNLSSVEETPSLSISESLLLSLLGAWVLFVCEWLIWTKGSGEGDLAIYSFVVGLPALARVVLYASGYFTPISLWGRLITGRWIIPGYDRMLLPSFGAIVAGILLPLLLSGIGFPSYLAYPLSIFPVLLILLGAGPTLRDWRLTGQHRIHPGFLNRQLFEKI